MRAYLSDGSVYVDADDGEPFLIDRAGRIGLETDDGRIAWYVVHAGAFVPVGTEEPSPEVAKLLDLVSYGVGGAPDPTT